MNKQTTSACRYALLTTALRRGIEEGRYAMGSVLPTEAELCEQFNVSRHTVREALRQLRNMGLVASRQGSGTVVTANNVTPHYIQSLDSFEDLIEFCRQAKGEVLNTDIRQIPDEIAQMCGLPFPSQRLWLYMQILRYWGKDNLPTLLSNVFIDAKYSTIKDHYDPAVPLSITLEQKFGVVPAIVEQEIQAIILDKKHSELLHTKSGIPALQSIRRCCTANGELLLVSVNIAPSERYTYLTRLRVTSQRAPVS